MCIRPPPDIPHRVAYYTFAELQEAAVRLPPRWVLLRRAEGFLGLGLVDDEADVEIKVIFRGDFSPVVSRQGFPVTRNFVDVEEHGLRRFLLDLEQSTWCPGSDPRAKKCPVAVQVQGLCVFCEAEHNKRLQKVQRPILLHTPLSSVDKPALIREVKTIRLKLKETESELEAVQRKLKREAVDVDKDVKEGLQQVLDSADLSQQKSFIQLFYDEQKKAASVDPRGMRWHPMMIRFAIYLHYQSPRAYEALRNTGVLHLPNKSTLRDYTSVFAPEEGFQAHVFLDIKRAIHDLPPEKRFAVLLHDEMAIRGDLVYDHRGGQIVGFINPQAWNFNEINENALATHVLVFMAVGINNNVKQSIGYFSGLSLSSDMLFPLMWEAVAYLEQQGLRIISSTSDKASPNQRLYRIHGDGQIVHESVNVFAQDGRSIYFISDPPHLIKTIRNNLEKSKPGSTRYLWKNDQHLLWAQITAVYDDDVQNALRMTKLRDEHVRLTPSSRMSVRLAAQVLSNSVGIVLRDYHGPQANEMAKFVLLCDRFFDCLNSRSFVEHIQKRKPDLAPYQTVNDPRFDFLDSFATYLEEWKTSVANREGFTKAEKQKMFLSQQTYEGIVTTVRGFRGAAQYLLSNGVSYLFSNVFCQDPLEEHFGRHRGLGHRSRNPSVYEFGHQENQLRIQRGLAFQFQPRGNTAGRARAGDQIQVDDQPLPRVRRQ